MDDIIDIDLRSDFEDNVPRVLDVDLGRHLGIAQPIDIRSTIKEHAEFLRKIAVLVQRPKTSTKLGGRPTMEFWLDREQSFYIATQSRTERGRHTALLLVQAFKAFEQIVLQRIPQLLRADAGPWSKTWHDELMKELCALKGELFTGGRHPRWCAKMNSIIYECLLGREVYQRLKQQNPNPRAGHNHHQFITPEFREAFEKQLGIVTALAATSVSLADLNSKLRKLYQSEPLQLPLFDAGQRMLGPGLAKLGPSLKAKKEPA